MDDDLFDDDIDDDDLFQAVDEALSARASQPTPSASNVSHLQKPAAQQPQYKPPAHSKPNGRPATAEAKPPPVQNAPPPRTLQRQISIPRQPVSTQPRQSQNLRQATLFGDTLDDDPDRDRSAARPQAAYRNDANREPETHHDLDQEALDTWVYPMNLGAVRDYQYSIVKNSLFNNTLVALPTGLGKTFIAATVMLNFYRWTRTAQIVFVAPTKPLAAQQVEACFSIVGIPRSDTTLLTGEVSPGLRVEEWEKKRVFFMTPQTLQNDLSNGYADPKRIALLVVDEAHRAVGEYAYAKVVKFIRRFSRSIRILALTATPGSKVETVQEVIDNLGISHVEIRTEESLDIRQYVHRRDVEEEVLDFSDEIHKVRELFSLALQPLVDKLSQQNIYWGRDPMSLTQYGLVKTQQDWWAGPGRQANQGVQNMMRAVFGVLGSVAHSIKLLNFHGIKPFYDNMNTLRSEVEARGKGGSKYRLSLVKDKNFQEVMDTVEKWLSTPGFIGHPKLNVLSDRILNHFMDNPTQSSGSSTKIIVFSEYRDSAEEIVRVLNLHRPLVRASVFVGQADSKRSEGMKQAQQIKTIEDFRAGKFNVLVATSIGEEGLDIGQVDLIVCYDASSSPIRMLQRMGRTGRKRAGRIILLLMQGKEQDNYAKSKDSYAAMQKLICEGSRFNFRFDLSTRIVPRNKVPAVDKKVIDIPPENTQVQGLPEPKRTRVPKKKKPPKKFHMPEGAITGFMKASDLDGDGCVKATVRKKKAPEPVETDFVADMPPFHSVVLTQAQQSEFRRVYQVVHGDQEGDVCVDMGGHPEVQRRLGPTVRLKHGKYTKRVVKLLSGLSKTEETRFPPLECPPYQHLPQPELVDSSDEGDASSTKEPAGRNKRRRLSEPSFTDEEEGQYEGPEPAVSRSRPAKRKQKLPGGRGRVRGSRQQVTTFGVAGGDFCDSEEEIPEVLGDDGDDLRDFIVSDSEGSPPTSPATTPQRSDSLASRGATKSANTAALDMAIDAAMDLSDEDMPSLSQLMHPVKVPKTTHPRGQRQAWLIDSDDDDLLSDVDVAGGGDGKDVPGREESVDDEDGEPLGLTQRTARNRCVIEDSDSDGL